MRRMFSNRIARSAKFLQMPLEAQALYFHFILNADDDGVVETYPIISMLNTAPDVLKILLAKHFIQILNEDQVMLINDWLEHNKIRADRKIDSIYKHLIPNDIKLIEPMPRSDVEDNSKRLSGQSTDGISKVKLSKVKLSKDSSNIATPNGVANINDLIKLFEIVNPSYETLYKNKTQRSCLERMLKKYGEEKLRVIIEILPRINKIPYMVITTTPYELEKNMGKIKGKMEQEKSKVVKNKSKIGIIK